MRKKSIRTLIQGITFAVLTVEFYIWKILKRNSEEISGISCNERLRKIISILRECTPATAYSSFNFQMLTVCFTCTSTINFFTRENLAKNMTENIPRALLLLIFAKFFSLRNIFERFPITLDLRGQNMLNNYMWLWHFYFYFDKVLKYNFPTGKWYCIGFINAALFMLSFGC